MGLWLCQGAIFKWVCVFWGVVCLLVNWLGPLHYKINNQSIINNQ